MQRQLWWIGGIGLMLIFASGLGYDPLLWLVPGVPPGLFPSLCMIVLIVWLALRLQAVSATLAGVMAQYEQTQAQIHATLARLDDTATQHATVATAVEEMRRLMAQNTWLIPGKMLLLQHRYDDAIKLFQETLASQPDDPQLHWLLGEALCGSKRHLEALPHLRLGFHAVGPGVPGPDGAVRASSGPLCRG